MSCVSSPLGKRSPLFLSAAVWLKCQKDSKSRPGSAAGQRGNPRQGFVNVNVSPKFRSRKKVWYFLAYFTRLDFKPNN